MKIIISSILVALILCSATVNESDKCKTCSDLKSEKNCGQLSGCTWNSSTNSQGTCVESTTSVVVTNYCSKIASTNCAKTNGCALVYGSCVLFSGCTEYLKTSLDECQNISRKCVTDGINCMDATDCHFYSQQICEQTYNSSGRQCKWDSITKACRDYQCSEALTSITTDRQCDAFSAGCVTTGQGCITPPLPPCSTYSGTIETCKLMKGNLSNCDYDSISLKCKAKQCQNAPTSTNTDTACNDYLAGCVTTGKGCINILGACSSYSVTNPQSDCQGYIGLDGICEGDSGATTCRSRICDNGIGSTDKSCNDYKKGCISNGIKCTNSKSQCSGYKGTITTCQQYLATDGNCKGTSDIEGPCKLKDCVEDSQTSYITDVLCQSNIQSWCKSTGKGCVKTLQSCTTYIADEQECFTLIGSEGKCTVGTSGQCAPRKCESAPNTYTTNQECSDYFTNCVTNGSGCIQQATCQNTVIQLTCSGTKENQIPCTWGPTCISNQSCSSFTLQSICISNLAAKVNGSSFPKYACKWDSTSSTCINALCTDFTGSNYITNEACDNVFPGCVTNGIGCVDPSTCSTSFQGTKSNCLSYKAYCTNSDQAISTDSCIQRTCNDSGLTYQSDQDCINYLPECLTNGNGCISNTSPCSGYQGTQNQCNQFYGYYNGYIKGARCWNTSTDVSQCIEKQCIHAQGMKNNNDCYQFLKGCLYDGSNSCLDKSATCSNYKYTTDPSICQNFKGVNGTILCYQSTSNQCKNRVCSDNITATKNSECNQFLSGCLTKGTGCISPTEPCSSYQGTSEKCSQFIGNSLQCANIQQCFAKICSNKTDATSNSDCMNFHSKCRLKQGGSICEDAQSQCTGYTLQSSVSINDKQTYCNLLTTSNGNKCSYDPNISSTCVDRTCALWDPLSQTQCINYLGLHTCNYENQVCNEIQTCEKISSPTSAVQCNNKMQSGQCQYFQSKCYTTQQDCAGYSLIGIPSGSESNFCSSLNSYKNGVAYKCAYDSATTSNCIFSSISAISFNTNQPFITCENIIGPTNQDNCDQIAVSYICTYLLGVCYTIQSSCTNYVIPKQFITQIQQQVFCQNMIEQDTQKLCTFEIGQSNCLDPIFNCSDLSYDDSFTPEYCLQRNYLGDLCLYLSEVSYDTCTDTIDTEGCTLIENPTSDYDCEIRGQYYACVLSPSGKCVFKDSCSKFSVSGATSDDKAVYCQHYRDFDDNYCSWISTTKCAISKNSCTDWKGLTTTVDNSTFCSKRITKDGTKCSYIAGQANCSDYIPPQNSQADCDFYYAGTIYSNGTCNELPSRSANCNLQTATGSSDDQKFTFCNLLYSTANIPCTFIKGSANCINKGTCNTYDISSLTDNLFKQVACKAIKTTDENGCIYLGTGNFCSAMISKFSTCETVTGATNQSYCDAYVSNCYYYQQKCYTLSEACNYTTGGSGALLFCNAMKNSIGDYCTAISDTAANCIQRTCSDTVTTTMNKNSECKSYHSTCKSDGTKCIESSVSCSIQLYDCTSFLDTDNLTPCLQSDICLEQTAACSSYSGTISDCQLKIGLQGKCWGNSSSVSGACRARQCIDKVAANNDSDCDEFLSGCLYNGLGCIDKNSPCSSYQGTTNTCKIYKGNNGTVQCWSNSSTITQCKDKECSDFTGTDDQTCSAFLPTTSGSNPNCITDGKKCVTFPKNCLDFKGDAATCSKLTAQDGPCKSSLASCVPRVCIEAPASFNTDDQCKTYHPTCITNGRGCFKSDVGCNGIQTQTACSSNITCTWANSCKLSNSTCSQITGQSTCANTVLLNGIQCFWSNGQCRNITCTDYDNSLTTHSQCQDIDKICTTSGAGCVTLGTCNTYKSQSVCISANTTESSIRCTWDNNQCRQRICSDFSGKSDQECNSFLYGCKTAGSICIGQIYDCSVFNGNKSQCTQDSNSNQCYYLNDICYQYNSCQSIPYIDFDTCQSVSKGCVPSISNCISIRSCDQYDNQQSCIIGVNNTKCGWLSSTNKCQIFNNCTDYLSSSQQECQIYGSKCLTDGIKCIELTTCLQYLTQIACNNTGTDGLCTWVDNKNSCRLRECSDLIATTDQECTTFIVSTGVCTTNGTKCISRANCSEYLLEESCIIDKLGNPCLFTYPVGSTSGTKSCRAKECSDIQEITNELCISKLNSKPCVSNGTSCVKQSTCSSYMNQISCNGGGTDGNCAFTPVPTKTDPLSGTCQLFDSCEKANKDEASCRKKSQACFWSSVINGNTTTTSCSPLTCAQKAIGTECYPIPNFNGSKYTICSLQNNVCSTTDPSNLSSELCFLKSYYTYTWNQSSQKCVSCVNSANTTIENNQNNTTSQSDLMSNFVIYLIVLMTNI